MSVATVHTQMQDMLQRGSVEENANGGGKVKKGMEGSGGGGERSRGERHGKQWW